MNIMDTKYGEVVESHPIDNSNFVSICLFWWLKELINRKKNLHQLEAEDLYSTPLGERSDLLVNSLEKTWTEELHDAERNKRTPNFWRAFDKNFRRQFIKYGSFFCAYVIIQLLLPLLMNLAISYFVSSSTTSDLEAYTYVTLFNVTMVFLLIIRQQGFFWLTRLGIRSRVACSSLIYKKMIRLSSTSNQNNAGFIINLFSNDTENFVDFFVDLPVFFVFPIQLLVSAYFLYQYAGLYATITGLLLLFLQTIPVQIFMFKSRVKFQSKLVVRTDQRISLVTEIVNGIQTIKMQVMENFIAKLSFYSRKREIHANLALSYVWSFTYAFQYFIHRISILSMILVNLLHNRIMPVNEIVAATQYLAHLEESVNFYLTFAVKKITEIIVSVERIQNFLLDEEIQFKIKTTKEKDQAYSVLIKKVTASWDPESTSTPLKDISITIKPNKHYYVMGPIGSGKSCLLKLILDELHLMSGEIYVQGKISYASQEPWLFHSSVRDNIIFGEAYDKRRYDRVIEACALSDDFEQMPHGDRTMVGNRGCSLSGGQCARINLARAVYRRADIYLFDDPLSSVDSRVSKKIFDDCIDGLLKSKTLIIATHNNHYIKKSDDVILLCDGVLEFVGAYDDSCNNGEYIEFASSEYSKSIATDKSFIHNEAIIKQSMSDIQKLNIVENSEIESTDQELQEEEEEFLTKSNSSQSLLWRYVRTRGSPLILLMFLLTNFLFVATVAGFDYWLVSWNNEDGNILWKMVTSYDTKLMENSHVRIALMIFGGLITAIIVTGITKNILFSVFTLKASQKVYNKMILSLLGTHLRFFNVNSSGRILNRFINDVSVVDNSLPSLLFEIIDFLIIAIAMLSPIFILNWWSAIPFVILGYVFYKTCVTFIPTIQNISRLEKKAMSPILTLLASTFSGLTTIRAHEAQDFVTDKFLSLMNAYTSAHFTKLSFTHSFLLWIELAMAFVITSLLYSCVALKSSNFLASYVGLTFKQFISIYAFLSYSILLLANVSSAITSLERLFEFVDLEPESACEIQSTRKKNWPTDGALEFDQVSLRYSNDSEPILKDLSFIVEPQSKIGIVGRTGAGKSSLTSALLRLADLDGTIKIDGVDIKQVDLLELRSKISIIPQESVLFTMSLRSNLDPYKQFDDELLWHALRVVELNQIFTSLDEPIDQAGGSLSLGQKQLLCLARAIVKKDKILVLDEATAKVDSTTDALIQKTIRSEFENCTVLTIAHRLNTVMDSDKVLVMDNGQVVEYDHPYLLLKNKTGYLSKMVEQMGETTSSELEFIAEKAYRTSN